MYQDATKIRSHIVKLRFSDEENRLIQALTDYTGEQKAALLRELIIESAREIIAPISRPNEAAFLSQLGA